jgi:hypothetical protein
MTQFTPTMTKTDAEALVRGWIDARLWRQEAHRADTGGFDLLETEEIERMGDKEARELNSLMRLGTNLICDEQKQVIRRTLAGQEPLDHFAPIFGLAARDLGIPIDRTTADGRLLARTVLRGHATFLDEVRQAIAAIPAQVQAMVAKPVMPTFEFFTYWDEFVATKQSDGEWKADSALGAEATRKLFKALIGDLPFDKIDGDIAGRFRRTYQKLPFDHFHAKQWKSMTPEQVITKIEKLSEPAKRKIRTVGNKSANKHVMNLIEYWDYLDLNTKIPRGLENPFRGHLTARRQGRAARDEHPMWPEDLNQSLFSGPLYAGCKSIYRRTMPGQEVHRDALFWILLLGRTMGGRQDEFCSRLVGDIDWVDTVIGRVAYLKIRNSKTDSSARDVPFPELTLQLGFLEYRYYGRAPEEPLFPELIPQGVQPRRSNSFSSKFTEFRKKTKIYRPGVDFRSFRANVETELQNCENTNTGWIDELIGHDSQVRRSEGARYTKSIYMANLKRTIDKVSIGVELPQACRYSGPRGLQAPGAAQDIARYVALAQREMNKKIGRRGP